MPHIFMQQAILPQVIFSPGVLAIELAEGLSQWAIDVQLFSPGRVQTGLKSITADMSYFEAELAGRDYGYLDLLKKHSLTFVTLARQVQAELIAKAFAMANKDQLDLVHIYTNEEDIALPFAKFCRKPVIFTHHDPFNFLIGYKNNFPKHKDLNWVSISYAQRSGMPPDTNWVGNVYHGVPKDMFRPNFDNGSNYLAYLGRIIEPKGVHLAIEAIKHNNQRSKQRYSLKIAGKHYAGYKKDVYWQQHIAPYIDGQEIEYVGFADTRAKETLLRGAAAVIMPSLFSEPFGMVAVESLACATPVICLDSGALPEIVRDTETGLVVRKAYQATGKLDAEETAQRLAAAIDRVKIIDRRACYKDFQDRFTSERMCSEYAVVYRQLVAAD